MGQIKAIAEACDVLVKVVIAIIALVFVDKSQKAYELQKQQAELQKVQVETLKVPAENSKIQAEQITKLMADAQSVLRKDDAALVQLIVDLLFKQNASCRTEDQMLLVSFLGEMNDTYNRVKLGDRFAGAFGKRRECSTNSGALEADTKIVKTAGNGTIPILNLENLKSVVDPLLKAGGIQGRDGARIRKVSAEGAPRDMLRSAGQSEPITSPICDLLTGDRTNNLDVTDGSILKAKRPRILRANRRSTDDGHNPIVGQIADHKCVQTIDAFPNTRGQTWALVKPAICPERVRKAGG